MAITTNQVLIDREIVDKMNKMQYAQIPDFWSNEAVYIEEMEISKGLGGRDANNPDQGETRWKS